MANYSIYLESLQALSAALRSAMSLIDVRQAILRQYSLMPSSPTDGNQTAFFDAIFDVLPQIEKLREEEKLCRKEYSEFTNESFNSALEYILTCKDADISASSVSGFLQHLNLLNAVVIDRKAKGEEGLSFDKDRYLHVLEKVDTFSDVEQARAIKQSFQKIIDTEESYVGSK